MKSQVPRSCLMTHQLPSVQFATVGRIFASGTRECSRKETISVKGNIWRRAEFGSMAPKRKRATREHSPNKSAKATPEQDDDSAQLREAILDILKARKPGATC